MKRGIVAVLAVVMAYAPAVAPVGDVLRVPDGTVIEGSFVDGKREGRWVIRAPNGKVAEGPYVDGKREGHWVIRAPDGKVAEGPYVDGKQEGRWVVRFPEGKAVREADLRRELNSARDCRERAIGLGTARREFSPWGAAFYTARDDPPCVRMARNGRESVMATARQASFARMAREWDLRRELNSARDCRERAIGLGPERREFPSSIARGRFEGAIGPCASMWGTCGWGSGAREGPAHRLYRDVVANHGRTDYPMSFRLPFAGSFDASRFLEDLSRWPRGWFELGPLPGSDECRVFQGVDRPSRPCGEAEAARFKARHKREGEGER